MMYEMEQNRLVRWNDVHAREIIIPDGTAAIAAGAFARCKAVQSVRFPESLRTIGSGAFAGCTALEHVEFAPGLRRLGEGSFRGCISLRRIILPDSTASVHAGAFAQCTALEEAHLGAGLRRNIEGHTFFGCTSLRRIVVPRGVQRIKPQAFGSCTALEHAEFENEFIQIEPGAFAGCSALDAQTIGRIAAGIPDRGAVDIRSRGPGAAGRLSNYTRRDFCFDGVQCASIEGVVQSFKCPDPAIQAGICALDGSRAKAAGAQWCWQEDQVLYWRAKAYDRCSDAYQQLLDRLFAAVYAQDASFRADLAELRGRRIDHRMGLSDPRQTVLTRQEFVQRLQRLIDSQD